MNASLLKSNDHTAHSVVQPLWHTFDLPEYYKNSGLIYHRINQAEMFKRGFDQPQLKSVIKYLPSDALVAGGSVASAVLGEALAGDIDLFFLSADAFERTYNLLTNPPNDEDAWGIRGYSCQNTLDEIRENDKLRYVKFTTSDEGKLPIQLIKLVWFDSAEATIDSFDFTVTQFAIHNGEFVFNPMAMYDLLNKRLIIHKVQFPVTSLRRLIKYANKGYKVDASMLLRIAEDIKASTTMADPTIDSYDP